MTGYELADEIYKDPKASKGLNVPTVEELKILKQKMLDAHPDRPSGDHKRFIAATEEYNKAQKLFKLGNQTLG